MPTNLDISFDTNDIIEADHVKQFADPIQDLESGSAWYRAATGSSNAYVVDFSDEDENGLDAGALTPGQIIHFKANHTNTGAATLAVDGTLGMGSAVPLTKNGGTALAAGDIQSGQMVAVLYSDESSGRFELIGGVGSGGGGGGGVDGSGTAGYLSKWSDSDTLTNSTAREAGSDNLGWGSGALGALSSGSGNIGIGTSALADVGTGNVNTAVGYQAGMSLDDGDNANVHVGYLAGQNATNVAAQVAIGSGAGKDAMGGGTVCIGASAGAKAGEYSFYGGSSSGFNNTGGYNIALGYEALYGTTGSNGTGNIAIGRQAGHEITTGAYNVCIGRDCGEALTTGNYNVAIGYQTAEAVQPGAHLVAIGFQALMHFNQSTTGVVAIGRAALTNFNTAGASAVAVGYAAGSDFSGTAGGVMVGKSAGFSASGDELVAIGSTAAGNASGDGVIAMGASACRYAVGNENIGIGSEAVRGYTDGTSATGTNNIGLGHRALVSFTSGGHNLAMGYETGDAVTTGIGNTMLGSYAGSAFSTGNYNVCLGHRAGDTATGSNKLYIHASSSSGATPLLGGEFDNRNLGVNGSSYGSGQGVVFIADRVAAPSSNPSGGGILYVESGALKFRGSSGTITTVASA